MKRALCTLILLAIVSLHVRSQQIAITFDDAPTKDGPLFTGKMRSEKILQQLKDHQVKRVGFFVLTGNVTTGNEWRLQAYSKAGHMLANHSHTHQHIHRLGPPGYIADVAKAHEILNGYPAYRRWFRFPYLDEGRTIGARDSIREALHQLKLSNGYVTVDNYDWYLNHLLAQAYKEGRSIDMDILREVYVDHVYQSILFYDEIAREHIGRSPRHVLLLHENDLAALFLGDLIARLKGGGWKIISPDEAYDDPIATNIPDVLFNGQGRIAAIARAKGVPARYLVQLSEDERFLDELIKRRKVFQ